MAEVEALVAEFEASGLKRAVFCRQRDLALRTLDKYRHRMHGGRQSRGRSFVPVEVIPSTAPYVKSGAGRDGVLAVESRSGRRIEVCRGSDAGPLERLPAVLDRV